MQTNRLKTGPILNWCRALEVACQYSRLAYDRAVPEAPHLWLCDPETSSTALISRHDLFDVVAFKGTGELRDVKIDLHAFPPRPYAGGWCHPGFAKAHASIWPEVIQNLDFEKPVIFTGHSLGGALAELSAACSAAFRFPHMITFGKPNVWAKWTARRMHWLKMQLSVVSGSDAVARLPAIFYHPDALQDMLYFGNDGKDRLNPSRFERLKDFRLFEVLEDHSVDLYQMRLEEYLAEICHHESRLHNPDSFAVTPERVRNNSPDA